MMAHALVRPSRSLLSEPLSVFISYRRDEASHLAGRLADRLAEQFRIFMDVEAIEAGTDFAEVVHRAVSECHVLLAIIGPGWLNTVDKGGHRRLDEADDWVSEEIGVAGEGQTVSVTMVSAQQDQRRRTLWPVALISLLAIVTAGGFI